MVCADGCLNVLDFGAVGDGSSHPLSTVYSTLAAAQAVYPFATALTNELDWAAIQAACNAANVFLPSTNPPCIRGNVVWIPRGIYLCDQPIALNRTLGVTLHGAGSGGAGVGIGEGAGTLLRYTGGGSGSFIDARSSNGLTITGLTIFYSHGFTGDLIDLSHYPGFGDSWHFTLRDAALGADQTVADARTGAHSLLSMDEAISSLVDNCVFGVAQSAIRFLKIVGGHNPYSNSHVIQNSLFVYHRNSLVNPGQNIVITGNTFEGTGGALQHALTDDLPHTMTTLLTFGSNGITRSNGSWIEDGWQVGSTPVMVSGSASNNGSIGKVTAVTDTLLTVSVALHAEQSNAATVSYANFTPTVANALTFSGNTITRSSGSWLADNWSPGLSATIIGSLHNNGVPPPVTAVTDTTLTLGSAAFTAETSNLATVEMQLGTGPITFIGNWMGDQFLQTQWIYLNMHVGAISIIGNQFVGGERAIVFAGGGGGASITGNQFVTTHEPILFSGGPGFSGAYIKGNEAAAALYKATGPVTLIDCSANSTSSASDVIDLFAQSIKLRGAPLQMFPTGVSSPGGGYGTFAWQLSQGGFGFGIGSDATSVYLQQYGGKALRLNDIGGFNVTACRGTGKVGVGADPTTASKMQVAGNSEAHGFVLPSPNGTRYLVQVANDGSLSTVLAP